MKNVPPKISLTPTLENIESLFSNFNEHFYNNKLHHALLTISPDSTKGSYGWCTTYEAWKFKNSENGYFEINICAEYLNRPFEEVCATLLHEMAHLYNLQNDIKDTSRGGTYHNKKFKDTAEKHGLVIEHNPKYGWTLTTLNEHAREYVNSLSNTVLTLYREVPEKAETVKSRQSTQKYVCPECGCIIRATKIVNILCADCNIKFERQ